MSVAEGKPRAERGWPSTARLIAAAVALALTFAPFYATPISDIDVWWHLAAGKWIAENGRIPDVDPFGVFGQGNPIRMATVLKGQWLGQVALFRVFEGFGVRGVVALRILLLSACVVATYLRAGRLGSRAVASTFATMLVGLGLLGYTGDRPQLFSFAMAATLMFLVEEMDRGRRWTLAAIPAIGVLWTNLHGAVLIGVGVLAQLTCVEALSALRGGERRRLGNLALATVLFAVTTVLSPNGIVTYAYVAQTQGGELASRTTEYVGSLGVFRVGGWERQILVWAYFAAAAASLPWLLRASAPRAAALAFLGVASAVSYRYHAFFLVMGAPWIASALAPPIGRAVGGCRGAWAAIGSTWAAGAILLACLHAPLQAVDSPVALAQLPVAAVERIRAAGGGRVLAWFNWGGYVLWELGAAARPFVDPRMLDDASLRPYTHMIWATPEGMVELDRERFTFVLLPFASPTGEIYPLHRVLREREDWAVEYVWRAGTLYRRRAQ